MSMLGKQRKYGLDSMVTVDEGPFRVIKVYYSCLVEKESSDPKCRSTFYFRGIKASISYVSSVNNMEWKSTGLREGWDSG